MTTRYKIRQVLADDAPEQDAEPLFWSNEDGWVDFASADYWTDPKYTILPIGGEWVRLAQRFSDAYMIQQGACNPSGIARSLVQACDECYAEGVSARDDPAVRMITHQLAYLMNVGEIDRGPSDVYTKLYDECRDKHDDLSKGVFSVSR